MRRFPDGDPVEAEVSTRSIPARTCEIVMMDAFGLSDAIASRDVSCSEVMTAYLDHIERVNPLVNAIVSLEDRGNLLSQAAERDAEVARGAPLGWMHGFPVAIKDLARTKGIRTTRGSLIHKDDVPDGDALFVRRMKDAGCVVIGKTNTPEFGLGSHTVNDVFGTTLNAYDQSRSAGGSSGGAAVALALRMVPVADGSDHAGSLRNPAAFNNVLGFRPTPGLVPIEGRELCTPHLGVAGPMARTVPDLAGLLATQAGRRPPEPATQRGQRAPAPFHDLLKRGFEGTRVCWLDDLGGYLPCEPEMLRLCERALEVFEAIGGRIERAGPDFATDRVWEAWVTLRAWQVGGALKSYADDPYRASLIRHEARCEVERGRGLTAFDVYDAWATRNRWRRAVETLFERYDYLLLPSAQVLPFDATVECPTVINGHAMDTYHRWMETAIFATMAGCPALSVPVGFSEGGLPAGLQIIARSGADLSCLQLAHAYEQGSRWVSTKVPDLLGR